MKLGQVAEAICAKVLHPQGAVADADVDRVFAGNRMSELLNQATSTTLIVTNLSNSHLARLAELFDVPGICLVDAVEPDPSLLRAICQCRTSLMVSPLTLDEVGERLRSCGIESFEGPSQ